MPPETSETNINRSGFAGPCPAERIGLAQLTRMYEAKIDLHPLWHQLITRLMNGTIEAGEAIDLSVIAQLLGDKQAGLAIQHMVLASHRLFRSPCAVGPPRLRVLALAAATDIGSNTPIEFLLEGSGIELTTLYVVPEVDWPDRLPYHDVAIVTASDSEDCRPALNKIAGMAAGWPTPLLNPPHLIGNLDRDKLHRLIGGIDGLEIPATVAISREALVQLSRSTLALSDLVSALAFPIIIRPRGSHAGRGLARIDRAPALAAYLGDHVEAEFFISRYIDYSGSDGLFRKYRIAFIEGRPYACHLAIADRWDVWYANAQMADSAARRAEEEAFMRSFDMRFAQRHSAALGGLAERVGLDYFTVDCAETRDGALLVFEADNTAIVHDMDPPEVFPYKVPQMQKVFAAFAAMLFRRAGRLGEAAA